eukprot:1313735-Ditylum_brightwellii.AAC.2
MKMCLYKRFIKRFSLSYVRISGASRKLPNDCEEKAAQIIAHVGHDQTPHTDNQGIFIPPIQDEDYCNTDHIPCYIDMTGNYTWGE